MKLYRFFFPKDGPGIINIESEAHALKIPGQPIIVNRTFYTFRALFNFSYHYFKGTFFGRHKEYVEHGSIRWMVHAERGAIAFDFDTNGGVDTDNTDSFAVTVSGVNPYAACGVAARTATDANRPVLSFTINSASAYRLRADPSDATDVSSEAWGQVNPTTGNAVITMTGTVVTGWTAGVIIFSGVDQNHPVDIVTGAVGAQQTTISESIVSTVPNCWLWDIVYSKADNVLTAGASQTQSWQTAPNAGGDHAAMSYRGPVVTPASTAMTWGLTGAPGPEDYAHTLVALRPALGAFKKRILKPRPFSPAVAGLGQFRKMF